MAVSLGPCCRHTGLVPDSLLHLPGHTLHCGWQDLALSQVWTKTQTLHLCGPALTHLPSLTRLWEAHQGGQTVGRRANHF